MTKVAGRRPTEVGLPCISVKVTGKSFIIRGVACHLMVVSAVGLCRLTTIVRPCLTETQLGQGIGQDRDAEGGGAAQDRRREAGPRVVRAAIDEPAAPQSFTQPGRRAGQDAACLVGHRERS